VNEYNKRVKTCFEKVYYPDVIGVIVRSSLANELVCGMLFKGLIGSFLFQKRFVKTHGRKNQSSLLLGLSQ